MKRVKRESIIIETWDDIIHTTAKVYAGDSEEVAILLKATFFLKSQEVIVRVTDYRQEPIIQLHCDFHNGNSVTGKVAEMRVKSYLETIPVELPAKLLPYIGF